MKGIRPKEEGLKRFVHEPSERNALILSIAFFLIFTAFNTAQNFATSALGNEGAISLAILYAVLTVSNIVIPAAMQFISSKYAMFFGSITYAFFVLANVHVINYVLYGASALEGIGAALLWVAQGSFITECSNVYEKKYGYELNSQLGYFNGIFWSTFQGTQFVGNLLCALLFQFDLSNTIVYIVLTVINVCGCLTLLLITPFKQLDAASAIKRKKKKQERKRKQREKQREREIEREIERERERERQRDGQNIMGYDDNNIINNNKVDGLIPPNFSHNDDTGNALLRDANSNEKMYEKLTQSHSQQGNVQNEQSSLINLHDSNSNMRNEPFIASGYNNNNNRNGNNNMSDDSLLSDSNDDESTVLEPNVKQVEKPKAVNIFSAMKLWLDPKLQCLILLTIYTGLSESFEYGLFPTMIDNKSHKFYALAVFGFTDALCSLWFGKMSDRVGRLPILIVVMLCHGFAFLYIYFYDIPQSQLYIFCIVAVFFGVGDAGLNTQMNVLYPSLLGEKEETFANYKFFQSIAFTWGFAWDDQVSWNTKLYTNFGFVVFSLLPLFLNKDVYRVATVRNQK